MVVLLHARAFLTTGELHTALTPISAAGRQGVTFFFVLSGFVLAWSARSALATRDFYRRRFARIYPVYLACIAAGLLVSRFAENQPFSAKQTLADTLLLQAWIPSRAYFFSLDGAAWSLSCEAFFYALFPLLFAVGLRMTTGQRRGTFYGLSGLYMVAQLGLALHAPHSDGGLVLDRASWLGIICPVTNLLPFALGVFLALRMRIDGWRLRVRFDVACMITVGSMAAISMLRPQHLGWEGLTALVWMTLIASAAQADLYGVATPLRGERLVALGESSFCLYLAHALILLIMFRLVGSGTGLAAGLAVVLLVVVSLVAASLLHRFLEQPLEARLSGRLAVWPASVAVPKPASAVSPVPST